MLLVAGLHGGPVDGDALALHAAEPCHLALCELVDGGGELRAHLLESEFSDEIERNEFVFQSVIYQVLWWNGSAGLAI